MENMNMKEATCDSCGRVFSAIAKRYYCSHCNEYFYICNSCAEAQAKCRFCGVPLKRRAEPQFVQSRRRAAEQRA